MAQFKTIVEAVLYNSLDCVLDRVVCPVDEQGYGRLPRAATLWVLEIGDRIVLQERETEVI